MVDLRFEIQDSSPESKLLVSILSHLPVANYFVHSSVQGGGTGTRSPDTFPQARALQLDVGEGMVV